MRSKVSLRSMKGFSWELILSFLLFFEPDLKIEIFFEKEGAAEESNIITVNVPAAKYCCRSRKISYRSYLLFSFSHLKRMEWLFYLLFGWPTANFGLLSQGQPLLPNINHCVLVFLICRLPQALLQGWIEQPSKYSM